MLFWAILSLMSKAVFWNISPLQFGMKQFRLLAVAFIFATTVTTSTTILFSLNEATL